VLSKDGFQCSCNVLVISLFSVYTAVHARLSVNKTKMFYTRSKLLCQTLFWQKSFGPIVTECEAHNYSIFIANHVRMSDRYSESSSWAPILYMRHTYLPVHTRPTSILSDSRLRNNNPPSWVNTYPHFRR
jgi:hypothetical protein